MILIDGKDFEKPFLSLSGEQFTNQITETQCNNCLQYYPIKTESDMK